MSIIHGSPRRQHHGAGRRPPSADRSTTFSTEKELAKLVSECPILPLIVLPALHAVPGAEADEKDRGLEIRSVQFAAAFTIRITGNFAPLTSATSIRSMAR